MDDGVATTSTIPADDSGTNGREHVIKTLSVGFTALVVVLAAVGVFGVRTVVASGSAKGYSISVSHAAMTRPGLATPFSVEVTRDDGMPLPTRLTVRVDSSYLAMFDDNGMEPLPDASFNTAASTWWTFEIPEGRKTFRVDLDARLEPAVQWGQEASAAVEVEGVEMAEVEFATWVMP